MASGEDENESMVGQESLRRAESFLEIQDYRKAFAHFLLGLQLLPDERDGFQDHFALAEQEWGDELVRTSQVQQLFLVFEQASSLYPHCHTLLNNMGSQLFRLGYIDEAACYFRRALQIDPDFLSARENLDNICSHLVERWHFRMLNDERRNEAYQRAIEQALQKGHRHVLDIGSGTGLLSMIATAGEAESVHACEMTKAMYEVSCDIIAANDMSDKINLMHKMSTDLTIPADLPHKVSLVVTETFDAGLLGEHILSTLGHAWEELLADEQHLPATVIPAKATVFICAIEAPDIRTHNRMIYPGMRGLDLSSVHIQCQTSSGGSNQQALATQSDATSEHIEPEPYTTERLDALPSKYRQLTKVIKAFEFNFNDAQSLTRQQQGVKHYEHIEVIRQGKLDAIAMWFDLELAPSVVLSSAPGEAGCWEQAVFPVLSTHRNPPTDFATSSLVEVGNILDIECCCHGNSLHFYCRHIDRSPIGHNTNVDRPVLVETLPQPPPYTRESYDSGDGHRISEAMQASPPPTLPALPTSLSPPTSSLNIALPSCSSDTMQTSPPALNTADMYKTMHIDAASNRDKVAAISNNVSPFGKLSVNGDMAIGDGHLDVCDLTDPISVPQDFDLVQKLQEQSITPMDSVHNFPSHGSTDQLTPSQQELYLLERHELALLNDIDLNTAYCDAIKTVMGRYCCDDNTACCSAGGWSMLELSRTGLSLLSLQACMLGAQKVDITEHAKSDSDQRFKLLLTIAKNNGISVENKLGQVSGSLSGCERCYDLLVVDVVDSMGCLHQQILHDVAIARCMCVLPQGRVIPQSVAVYGMVVDSLSLLQDSALVSDSRTLGFKVADYINDFQMKTHVDIDLSILEYKKLSEPVELLFFNLNEVLTTEETPSFLQQSKTVKLTALNIGQATAVVYWFELTLSPEIKISTLSRQFHWRQAAVMQKRNINVLQGEQMTLKAVCTNSCIDVQVTVPHNAQAR